MNAFLGSSDWFTTSFAANWIRLVSSTTAHADTATISPAAPPTSQPPITIGTPQRTDTDRLEDQIKSCQPSYQKYESQVATAREKCAKLRVTKKRGTLIQDTELCQKAAEDCFGAMNSYVYFGNPSDKKKRRDQSKRVGEEMADACPPFQMQKMKLEGSILKDHQDTVKDLEDDIFKLMKKISDSKIKYEKDSLDIQAQITKAQQDQRAVTEDIQRALSNQQLQNSQQAQKLLSAYRELQAQLDRLRTSDLQKARTAYLNSIQDTYQDCISKAEESSTMTVNALAAQAMNNTHIPFDWLIRTKGRSEQEKQQMIVRYRAAKCMEGPGKLGDLQKLERAYQDGLRDMRLKEQEILRRIEDVIAQRDLLNSEQIVLSQNLTQQSNTQLNNLRNTILQHMRSMEIAAQQHGEEIGLLNAELANKHQEKLKSESTLVALGLANLKDVRGEYSKALASSDNGRDSIKATVTLEEYDEALESIGKINITFKKAQDDCLCSKDDSGKVKTDFEAVLGSLAPTTGQNSILDGYVKQAQRACEALSKKESRESTTGDSTVSQGGN